MTTRANDRAPSPRTRLVAVVEALPEAFVAVLASGAALGMVSAWLGVRPLAGAGTSRLLVALLLVVGAVVLARSARANRAHASPLVVAPSLVLLGLAVGARWLSAGDRAEWFLGGDHVRHLVYVADERLAGNLDYGTQAYPRAWHTMVAALWSASGARVDEDGLRSLVDLMSTVTWFLPALLSLATGSLTVALARRCGAGRRQGDVAGLGGAAAIMLPTFLADFQALGFENSYVVAIVLAVVAREVVLVDERRRGRSLAVAILGIVVCAHSWQLLLPPAGIAFLWLAWPVAWRGSARARGGLAAASALGAAMAIPSVLAVFTSFGIDHATESGVAAPLPVLLLVFETCAAVTLVARHRSGRSLLAVVAIAVLPALTAVVVALALGIPLTDYYPGKLLWHTAALGVPPLVVGIVLAWASLGRRGSAVWSRAARVIGFATAALGLVYALVGPAAAFHGGWSTVRGPVVLDAVTTPGARQAQVVWLGATGDDLIARLLLDYYRLPDPARTPQSPLDVAGECQLLDAVDRPAVLSDRTAAEVRRRYTCSPDVGLVSVAAR